MLRGGALRDAVTAFEVYAEKSVEELLSWYGVESSDGKNFRLAVVVSPNHLSPAWHALRRIHGALGNQLETERIRYIRRLRHLLTHQRGELRTEEQRSHFASEADADDWLVGEARVGGDVPLAHDRVLAMMDDIGEAVRVSDEAVWSHTWGRAGFPDALRDLTEGRAPVLEWRERERRP